MDIRSLLRVESTLRHGCSRIGVASFFGSSTDADQAHEKDLSGSFASVTKATTSRFKPNIWSGLVAFPSFLHWHGPLAFVGTATKKVSEVSRKITIGFDWQRSFESSRISFGMSAAKRLSKVRIEGASVTTGYTLIGDSDGSSLVGRSLVSQDLLLD